MPAWKSGSANELLVRLPVPTFLERLVGTDVWGYIPLTVSVSRRESPPSAVVTVPRPVQPFFRRRRRRRHRRVAFPPTKSGFSSSKTRAFPYFPQFSDSGVVFPYCFAVWSAVEVTGRSVWISAVGTTGTGVHIYIYIYMHSFVWIEKSIGFVEGWNATFKADWCLPGNIIFRGDSLLRLLGTWTSLVLSSMVRQSPSWSSPLGVCGRRAPIVWSTTNPKHLLNGPHLSLPRLVYLLCVYYRAYDVLVLQLIFVSFLRQRQNWKWGTIHRITYRWKGIYQSLEMSTR